MARAIDRLRALRFPGRPGPTRSVTREDMDTALKAHVVPRLRARGFTGRYPHFRRAGSDRTDFVSVQFSTTGGSFCVEIGATGPNGPFVGPGRDMPPDRRKVHHVRDRVRLGADPGQGRPDHWYVFAPVAGSTEVAGGTADSVALAVLDDFDEQAEAWWAAWSEDRKTRP